jgi:hypothetical protein
MTHYSELALQLVGISCFTNCEVSHLESSDWFQRLLVYLDYNTTGKLFVCVIEIIDIECVLLSILSEKFVSRKWRIYKGILVGPRLLRRGISRGCREYELFLQLQSLQKNLYRDLKWKKSFIKWKKCLKTHSSGLFYEKQQFWTEYMQKSSFKNKFSTLLCKPKQNPKDQDKLKLNRYVL